MKRRLVLSIGLVAACSSAPAPGPEKPVVTTAAKTATGVRPVAVYDKHMGDADPADACLRTTFPFRQPVAVNEDRDLVRYPPVIGFPMAFPKSGALKSLNGFQAITLDGEALTTQLETLSRWGDGPLGCDAPIRWAYAFALADVPPGKRSYLGLAHNPAKTPAAPLKLTLTEDKDQVVVVTGPARFTIRKDWFNGLGTVELAGPNGAWEKIAETPATGESGLLVLKDKGLASPLNGKRLSFEVERRGPVIATIAVKGTYAEKNQAPIFRYTVRFSFYAGTGAVLVEHTYYNGATETISAEGAKNRVTTDRVFMRVPVSLGGAKSVSVRATEKVHSAGGDKDVALTQDKRGPDRPAVVYAITSGGQQLELGTFADEPMLAVSGAAGFAVATLGHLGTRDPAALRWDAKSGALEIDFQSESLSIGGARGIWSRAMLDFGRPGVDLPLRGRQLYAHATRPLIGAPSPSYLNTTHAYAVLPETELPVRLQKLDDDIDDLHKNTVEYLRKYRITGSQLWPDLPRSSCAVDGTCAALEAGYFEGGDNNYWDWSMVELEQFLRSADPAFMFDYALWESITVAETISFRPDPGSKSHDSSFTGFSPCYGPGRSFDGTWSEGLNHRTGNCPGDYSYNKVHRLAYILTADRRYLDFFEDGATTALRLYGKVPKDRPPEWFELSATRQTIQYLEPLLNAAEFSRLGDDKNREIAKTTLGYFDFMRTRSLDRGHTCASPGTGIADPRLKGDCTSIQQWMMPVWADWIARLWFNYGHAPAKAWLFDWVKMSLPHITVLDKNGYPDLSAERKSSGADAENGWRTAYNCKADKKGIQDATCKKITEWENGNFFYANGLVAFLNAFGTVAEVDAEQTLGICKWFPETWLKAVANMDRVQLNEGVWGKSPGQAYAFAQRALAVIERCE